MYTKEFTKQTEQFQAGEPVIVLYQGHYNGMLGKFIGIRKDSNWADIEEAPGIVRAHPVDWIRRIDHRLHQAESGPHQFQPAADAIVTR